MQSCDKEKRGEKFDEKSNTCYEEVQQCLSNEINDNTKGPDVEREAEIQLYDPTSKFSVDLEKDQNEKVFLRSVSFHLKKSHACFILIHELDTMTMMHIVIDFQVDRGVTHGSFPDPCREYTTHSVSYVTSSNSQVFAYLCDHDIFYKWQRVKSSDNMTNHKRSTQLADEKAPRKTNNDAAGNYCVRHLIILKPRSNTRNHEKYNGCEITGKNYFYIAH